MSDSKSDPTVVSDSAPPPESEPAATNPVVAKLIEFKIDKDTAEKIVTELSPGSIDDLASVVERDLTEPPIGMKKLPARALLRSLASLAPTPAPTAAAAAATAATSAVALATILPSVPTDASWLESLRADGILKVDESSVIGAVRATLAHRVGLFEIPDILVERMREYAESLDEQVDPEFFKLRKLLTRRSYAELFAAIDGFEGSFVSDKVKREFFERIDTGMWPAIQTFQGQLKGWMENWLQGSMNPGVMMASFMSMAGGLGGTMLPPGIMAPPDTGIIRDGALSVNEAINRVFRGFGTYTAAAVAYDASKIRETMDNSRLPSMIGAPNREQMLRMLGVNVPATYTRLEQSLVQYVLSILRIKDLPAGNEEYQFYGALSMLGNQIPWDQINTMGRSPSSPEDRLSGIGARGRGRNPSSREL